LVGPVRHEGRHAAGSSNSISDTDVCRLNFG
jgi:hypothetical protein